MTDPLRSGIGYFSRRKDIAALAVVFTFGALLNAFGMVSPVYAVESWLGRVLHVGREAPVLGLIFTFFLILEPVVLLGLAAWCARLWSGNQRALLPLAVRYSYGLVPIGFGMWLAHYGFHFLTGLYTVIPVTQSALAHLGWPISGRAAMDSDRPAIQHRAGHRNWIPHTRICRVAGGNAWPGTRGFSGQAVARVRSLGGRLPHSLDGVDVAGVPTHGDARHPDERIVNV